MSSGFKVIYDEVALRQLRTMDQQSARRLVKWIEDRIVGCDNPRLWGKQLHGSVLGDNWRYRVGDYRVLCNIRDKILTIVIVNIGHRREIYR